MAIALDQLYGFKPSIRRCKLQSYSHTDENLILESDKTSFKHSSKQSTESTKKTFPRSFSTPCLPLTSLAGEGQDASHHHPKIEIVGGSGAPVHALVVEVAIAMASGSQPIPVSKGLGGAYVFRSQNGKDIAVAKPADEEPLALNNPKGIRGLFLHGQPGLKRSIRIGETGIRELAACFLDHDGFAGVPPTALVKFSHAAFYFTDAAAAVPSAIPCKISSLQRFVDHDFDAAELGSSCFSVSSVHKIGILDIRLLNLDRHAENILVRKKHGCNNQSHDACGVYELVPIDHGLCLPEWMDDPYFEWLHWPQASVPFSESELHYISKLDPFKDAELLRTKVPSLRECAIRVLVVCTIFLKQAAAAGFCVGDIGQMMPRQTCKGVGRLPSKLEDICSRAKAIVPHSSTLEKMKEETEHGSNMFQLDCPTQDGLSKALEMPCFPFAGSLLDESCGEKDDNENKTLDLDGKVDESESESDTKGFLTKSVSMFSRNQDCEKAVISFGEMNQGEWALFLETFEKLFRSMFEDNKGGRK